MLYTADKYYVYEWVRPDYDVVFWVGKGTRDRAYNFDRNPHTNNVVAKLSLNNLKPCVRILARFVNEDSAYDFECERIAFWAHTGELTNDLPGGRNGGGGMTGKKHTQETLKKMSEAQTGRIISNRTRHKLRLVNLGKRHTEESIKKIVEKIKGKKRTVETRKKISEAVLKYKNTEEGRKIALRVVSDIAANSSIREKRKKSCTAYTISKADYWGNKLSSSEIWQIGTLLNSKKDLSKKYEISTTAVDQIRRHVEKLLGVGPRKNFSTLGKKKSNESIQKCITAKTLFWANKSDAERKELGKKMSEGRKRAKEERLAALFNSQG